MANAKPMTRRLPLRQLLSVALGLCPPLVTVALRAEEGCVVAIEPKDANQTWRKAAQSADKRLAASDARAQCKHVSLQIGEDRRGRLTFMLLDGRSATRVLAGPEDLLPVLEALLVSLPAEPSSAVASSPSATPGVSSGAPATPGVSSSSPAKTASSSSPAKEASPPSVARSVGAAKVSAPAPSALGAPPRPAPALRGVFGASAGVRAGLDRDWFAPTLSARGSLVVARFELGVRGEWAPTSSPLGGTVPSGYSTYAGAAALSVGRRETWGRLELPYGVFGGIGGTHEQLDTYVVDTFETHAGAHAAVARLLGERLRLHVGLVFDALLSGARRKATDKRALPAIPHFGLGLQVGLEVMP